MPKTVQELLEIASATSAKPTRRERVSDEELLSLLSQQAYTLRELAELLDYSVYRMYNRMEKLRAEGRVVKLRVGRNVYYAATRALKSLQDNT